MLASTTLPFDPLEGSPLPPSHTKGHRSRSAAFGQRCRWQIEILLANSGPCAEQRTSHQRKHSWLHKGSKNLKPNISVPLGQWKKVINVLWLHKNKVASSSKGSVCVCAAITLTILGVWTHTPRKRRNNKASSSENKPRRELSSLELHPMK